jgi:hypothetical protein
MDDMNFSACYSSMFWEYVNYDEVYIQHSDFFFFTKKVVKYYIFRNVWNYMNNRE